MSDALLGRRRWDDPRVVQERDLLLGDDGQRVLDFVLQWREKALQQANGAFQDLMQAERRAFGEKSYFYRREQLLDPLPEDKDPGDYSTGTLFDHFEAEQEF